MITADPEALVRAALHMIPSPFASSSGQVVAAGLDHLACIAVGGADARAFLDNQLTSNVPAASSARATLAGYCTPKGRLLAVFTVWCEGDTIRMLVSRDIAPALVKRLRMYVLRSKVTIDDVTEATTIDGFVGASDIPPTLGLHAWSVARLDDAMWLRTPDADGSVRHLRIASDGAGALSSAVDGSTWRWTDIRAGIPRIVAATQERFVPQMLNLEALDGVDFKKGCFPGQEIVARSQYLGKLKRRMAIGRLDAGDLPAPGDDVSTAGNDEPVGLVVDAEAGPDGSVALLVELPLASFDANDLAVHGRPLRIERPPYPLPDNEVFVRPKL